MMRTTLNLDDDAMHEAIAISGNNNKTELINTALREYARYLKRMKLLSLSGKGIMDEKFDVNKLRDSENAEKYLD